MDLEKFKNMELEKLCKHIQGLRLAYDLGNEWPISTACPLNSPKLSLAVWPMHSCRNKLTQMKRFQNIASTVLWL